MDKNIFKVVCIVVLLAIATTCSVACQTKTSELTGLKSSGSAVIRGFNYRLSEPDHDTKQVLLYFDLEAFGLTSNSNLWVGAIVECKGKEPINALITMCNNGKVSKRNAVIALDPGDYKVTPAVFEIQPGQKTIVKAQDPNPHKANIANK